MWLIFRIFENRRVVYSEQYAQIEAEKKTTSNELTDGIDNNLTLSSNSPIYKQLGQIGFDWSEIQIFHTYIEIPRENIKVLTQLGIGEYGPLLDAEVQLNVNVKSRALIKVLM